MKILKILFVFLIPAVGIVGCKKSDAKPGGCHSAHETGSNSTATSKSVAPTDIVISTEGNVSVEPVVTGSAESSSTSNNRAINVSENSNGNIDNNGGTDIYGSGDDDRNGGDKSKKKAGAK